MTKVLENSIKSGKRLIEPRTPHKGEPPPPFVITQEVLDWLKTRIGWAADEINDLTEEKLRIILINGYKEGLSVEQIAQEIDTFFDSPMRSERIARTEIMMAYNQGAIEGYRQSGVVQKVEFYAALDERTCEICMGMHGDIEDINDAPSLPASTHPNCRCLWLPIVD